MGCYMSTPDNKVYITEGRGKRFCYATASCQGWRREQEDAEDCIPYFDDDASLFVLCDGHGGAEVAKYTVEHLPEFIKNHPLYKEGKYEEALERAFIDFDALLRTSEVEAELNRLAFEDEQNKKGDKVDNENDMEVKIEERAGSSSSSSVPEPDSGPGTSSAAGSSSAGPSTSSNNGPTSVVEDIDTETLRREAQVPLDELMSKYSAKPGERARTLSLKQYSASPVIRSSQKEDDEENSDKKDESTGASSSCEQQPSSSSIHLLAAPGARGMTAEERRRYLYDLTAEREFNEFFGKDEDEDSEDDSEFDVNDDSDSDEEEDEEEEDDDEDGDDERDEETTGEKSKSKRLRQKKHRRSASNRVEPTSDDESGDEFNGHDDDDIDDEEEENDMGAEGEDEEEDEDEDEDEDDDDEEDEEDDDEDEDSIDLDERFACLKGLKNLKASRAHKPGMDSGCTVVVALLKDNKLYVASAGDSRCIMVMRDGQCKPMSFDHKPEDTAESRRIHKAGGRVTEGRVNGGLNLSRALGDFTYKDPDLDAKDQMITPCPDVRTAMLDPDQVEYIFLACDGIWNSMKNQQVARFIRAVAPVVGHNLIEICLRLFRQCIAPGTDGDGTGCDNMTCILVKFESSLERNSSTNLSDLNAANAESQVEGGASTATDSVDSSTTNKRGADEESDDRPTSKRRCMRLLETK